MGAGQKQDHWIQDGSELYFVAKLQEELCNRNFNITDDIDKKMKDVYDHFNKRKCGMDIFTKSPYKINVDKHINNIATDLIKKYDKKMDVISVEVEYRNKCKKGDFILRFEDGSEVSYSLKNYKKNFRTIQVCSGTFPSLASRFVLTDDNCNGHVGPGIYLDSSKKRFRSSCVAKRNNYIKEIYPPEIAIKIIEYYNILDTYNVNIKDKYVKSPETAKWTKEVSDMWKLDCKNIGTTCSEILSDILSIIDNKKVKNIILKMCGLDLDCEELLCIDNNIYLCSSINDKWGELIDNLNSNDTICKIVNNGPRLCVSFIKNNNNILNVCIPFTLQKNGGWFLDEEYKETGYNHPKEKIFLNYGDRRPKKSKEISTSINTFFSISDLGFYQ